MRRYPFSPQPGWSISRLDTFRRCLRLYYFRYYARRHLSEPQQGVWARLSLLQPAALAVGSIVHEEIAALLRALQRGDRPPDLDEVAARAGGRLLALRDRGELMEDYYAAGSHPDLAPQLDRITRCLEGFLESRWWQWARVVSPEGRRRWVIEPEDFGEFRLEGMKAYARIDFAAPHRDGNTYVVDWKTGRPDPSRDRTQLQGCLLYAADVLDVPPEQGRATVVYLGTDAEPLKVDGLDTPARNSLRQRIAEETAQLRQQCVDPDENLPRPLEAFPLTGNLQECRRCPYRELCGR
jgi:hypothetical protein